MDSAARKGGRSSTLLSPATIWAARRLPAGAGAAGLVANGSMYSDAPPTSDMASPLQDDAPALPSSAPVVSTSISIS